MTASKRVYIQENLQTIMEWTKHAYPIMNNAVSL